MVAEANAGCFLMELRRSCVCVSRSLFLNFWNAGCNYSRVNVFLNKCSSLDGAFIYIPHPLELGTFSCGRCWVHFTKYTFNYLQSFFAAILYFNRGI